MGSGRLMVPAVSSVEGPEFGSHDGHMHLYVFENGFRRITSSILMIWTIWHGYKISTTEIWKSRLASLGIKNLDKKSTIRIFRIAYYLGNSILGVLDVSKI